MAINDRYACQTRTGRDQVDKPNLACSGNVVREELEALVCHLEELVGVGEDAVAVDDEEGEAACVPADDALGVIWVVEDALEEVVGLNFEERVVFLDPVLAERLEHEFALAAETIAIGRKANLRHRSDPNRDAARPRLWRTMFSHPHLWHSVRHVKCGQTGEKRHTVRLP